MNVKALIKKDLWILYVHLFNPSKNIEKIYSPSIKLIMSSLHFGGSLRTTLDLSKKLTNFLQGHVDQYLGMSNALLRVLASEMMPLLSQCRREQSDWDGDEGVRFHGVYNDLNLPEVRGRLADRNCDNTLILNVGGGAFPSGHFVTLHITRDKVYYFDPYGQPLPHPESASGFRLMDFLSRVSEKKLARDSLYAYNQVPIQSFKSVACGLYALLFCAIVEKGEDPFELVFHKLNEDEDNFDEDLKNKNDRLCVKYLEDTIQTCKHQFISHISRK